MKRKFVQILLAMSLITATSSVSAAYIFTYMTASGKYVQFCYNDWWMPIDCSELYD